MESDAQYYYKKDFKEISFTEIKANYYVDCTFESCDFLKCSQNEILDLIKSGNVLINCKYDPTIVFTNIVGTLHPEINLVDAFNRAFVSVSNKNKTRGKQLVLIDLD